MSFFDRLRTQKLLSFTLMLFTLSIGIVIGTLVNSGVKAAKDSSAAPGATPLVDSQPGGAVQHVQPDCQAGGTLGGQYSDHLRPKAASRASNSNSRRRASHARG